MKEIKVSVIIPVYNTELYLKECIDSILEQTLDAIEIIIINDGSTDGSLQIIKEYEIKHSNIKAINQSNQRQGTARNTGLKVASGEYVYFIDSDDILDNRALEYCYNLASKMKLDMLIFEADIFGNIVGKNSEQYLYHRRINEINEIVYGMEFLAKNYYRISMLNIPFTLYNRCFLVENKLQFLEKFFYEDYEFYYRTLEFNPKMMIINKIFYHRRFRDNSVMTSSITELSIMDKINIYNEIQEKSLAITKSLYLMICIRGMRKTLQECKKNNINLNSDNIQYIVNILKNIDVENCNISALMDIQYCMYLLNDILKEKLYDEKVYYRVKSYLKRIVFKLDTYNEKHIIGIYGYGDDCKAFLDIIERIYGELKCKRIYIQTKSVDTNMNKKNVYCIKDLSDIKINTILIGSFYYEKEIQESVKKHINYKCKVYSLKDDFRYYRI